MRILLLNDNSVARKLVALSAQYTKNDLTVIGSIADIEQSIYDVVIVDDAYYSDEMMSVLSQKVTYSVSILMAARANTVSEGFDKVLSKPFLPADLIEFLIEIQETLPAPSAPVVEDIPLSVEPLPPLKEVSSFSEPEPVASFDDLLPPLKEEPSFFSEPENVTTFNDPLPPLKEESSTSFGFAPLQEELEEEPLISFEEFAAPQESEARPSVFHHEAVQDLQDLLKTTDAEESDFSMGSFDLPEVETQEVEVAPFVSEPSQEENFFDAPLLSDTETSFGILSDDYLPLLEEKRDIIETSADEELYDEFIPAESFAMNTKESIHLHAEEMKTAFYSDETSAEPFAMNTKESIHPHAEEMKTAFYSDETSGDFFTGIPEREMKLAMGEPVEEITYDIPVVMSQTTQGGVSSEGMEALQVLLKALSNEETANSLKGLNISININLNLGQGK